MASALKQWSALVVLVALLGIFFYLKLYHYLSFDNLKLNRTVLLSWCQEHFLLAVFSFMMVYIVCVSASVPGATILSLAGGFMFGPWLGTLLVVISATLGSLLAFIAVKLAFHDYFAKRSQQWVKKMRRSFIDNAFSYLLFLRLMPIFPFWLINIVPALLGVSVRTFFIATLIGIIPGSVIYVSVGYSLGHVFDSQQSINLAIIFEPIVLFPLLGLALLSLLPVIYKQIKKPTNKDS
jgi:uncharacterized membrane protein YdjX (TVP38/TMEM64 family)